MRTLLVGIIGVIVTWQIARRRTPVVVPPKEKPTPRYIYSGSGTSKPNELDKYDFKRALSGKRAADRRVRSNQKLHAQVRRKATNVQPLPFPKRKTGG